MWLGIAVVMLALVIVGTIWQVRGRESVSPSPTAAVVLGSPAPAAAATTFPMVTEPTARVVATAAGSTTPILPQTCYEGATSINGTVPASGFVYTQAITTSIRCLDLNAQFSELPSSTYVTAVTCRDLEPFTTEKVIDRRDTWYIIAEKVRNGTCFKLRLRGDTGVPYNYRGVVAH